MVGWLIPNGSASSLTERTPVRSRSSMARRVGSDSAPKMTLSESGFLDFRRVAYIAILLYTNHASRGQAIGVFGVRHLGSDTWGQTPGVRHRPSRGSDSLKKGTGSYRLSRNLTPLVRLRCAKGSEPSASPSGSDPSRRLLHAAIGGNDLGWLAIRADDVGAADEFVGAVAHE